MVAFKSSMWVYANVEVDNSVSQRQSVGSLVHVGDRVTSMLASNLVGVFGKLEQISSCDFGFGRLSDFNFYFDLLLGCYWLVSWDSDVNFNIELIIFEEGRHDSPGQCSDVKGLNVMVMFVVGVVIVVVEDLLDVFGGKVEPKSLFDFVFQFFAFSPKGLLGQQPRFKTLIPDSF